MKAVILAAGIASRLRPLTNHTPKCLLEIGGKSLLERAIQGLLTNNIREIVLVTGYLQEQIVSFVQKKFPEVDVKFIYNEKYATTNNIYSLWLVKNSIQGENIILLDSDILFDPGLVTAVINSPYPDTLALNSHPLCEEEMKVIADPMGKEVLEPERLRKRLALLAGKMAAHQGNHDTGCQDNCDRMEPSQSQEESHMNHTFCQSCGMPIDAPALRGTERGGTPSEHYCKYCYQEGAFTGEMTMEEMIDFCTPMMVRANPELTPEQARAQMAQFFPSLLRWRN